MMVIARTFCSFVILLSLILFGSLVSADEPMPHLQLVLFTPADVQSPPGAERRMNEAAIYAEQFLVTWMKHWGYAPTREQIFDRNQDGSLRVLHVRGKESVRSGKYDKAGFEQEVWNAGVNQYRVGRHRHVWWIWVYLGDPPARFQGFIGRGNSHDGGNALVNYDSSPGTISLQDSLGAPFLEQIALKGCIHELGHALGLPHNGPLERDQLGMPLMGATIANYRRRTRSQETRAYLTAASAAMLWKHPLFSGTAEQRNAMPKFTLSDIRATRDPQSATIHITGRLQSELPAHSVVIYDSVPDDQETYWQKPYVARASADGEFDVPISEPTSAEGTLRLLVCFDNGVVSGTGQGHGIGSAQEIPYRFARGTYVLGR